MNLLDDYAPELLAFTGLGALIGGSFYAIWRGVETLARWFNG